MAKVIKGGTVITADRTFKADVLIEGEKIVAVGDNLSGDEVIDASNGILVESENTGQLADAMQQVMDNTHNYDRRQISRAAMEKFSYETVGRQIADQYTE